jgi:hypothetical protein
MLKSNQDSKDLKQTENLSRKKVFTEKIYVAVILLLIISCIGLCLYGRHKVNALNSKYVSLHATTASLSKKNKDLATMNANLQKSYATLKNAQKTSLAKSSTNTNISSSINPSPPQASTSFSIGSVQIKPKSYFGATNPSTSSIELLAVTVTIKNLSSTNQNYSNGEFSAITTKGVVKSSLIWGAPMPGEGNFWNNTTIAPGGSDTEVITFLKSDYDSDNFVTLQFSADSATTLSLPFPAPTD